MSTRRDRQAEVSLSGEIGIDEREVAWRKAFLSFGDDDVERLRSVHDIARRYAVPVIEEFYAHLLSFEEGRAFFPSEELLAYVKRQQVGYFTALTQGVYDAAYVEDRLHIGAVHERIQLPHKMYLGMYAFYLRAAARRIFQELPGEPQRAMDAVLSIAKLLFFDMSLALDTYVFRRERTIRMQQEAIREISTPVLPIRERLLVLPIIGALDTLRARQLTEQLLTSIRANRAKAVVIDITGVPVMDSKVANHLVQTVEAARLLGATAIITGLSAGIAETLVTLGVDLSTIRTAVDLRGGLEEAERLLGYKVVPIDAGP